MKSPAPTQRGILLLESLIAILLISFGILGLVGLWANSVKNASEAKYRSDATFLANEVIGTLWVDRTIIAAGDITSALPDWTARVAATLPGGGGSVVVDVDTNVVPAPVPPALKATVTVRWTLPGHGVQHSVVSIARINGAGPM